MTNSNLNPEELSRRCQSIRLLLMDCDGVLTDGRVMLLENGDEQKRFHARDGLGITLLHRAGLRSGIISGRSSSLVRRRARELGMPDEFVRQGCANKIETLAEILQAAQLDASEVGFIGDDLPDIPIMQRVGLAVAVSDAVLETKAAAHYVTSLTGGHGAVREAIELILKAQEKWDELTKHYVDSH